VELDQRLARWKDRITLPAPLLEDLAGVVRKGFASAVIFRGLSPPLSLRWKWFAE
jgi:hypothetical protein